MAFITTFFGFPVIIGANFFFWLTMGRLAGWLFQMVLLCLVVPVGIVIMNLRDSAARRARAAAHPDNNWRNLPRLNAVGFDKDGLWILPDSPEGKRILRRRPPGVKG